MGKKYLSPFEEEDNPLWLKKDKSFCFLVTHFTANLGSLYEVPGNTWHSVPQAVVPSKMHDHLNRWKQLAATARNCLVL